MINFTKKDGNIFGYSDNVESQSIAKDRIKKEGHVEISFDEMNAIVNPPLTPEQQATALKQAATQAAEKYINDELATRGYSPNGATLNIYAGITQAKIDAAPAEQRPLLTLYKAESQNALLFVAAVWAHMGAISAGLIPQPSSIEELVAGLPLMEWPVGSEPR